MEGATFHPVRAQPSRGYVRTGSIQVTAEFMKAN
jgi:hypothetical protein